MELKDGLYRISLKTRPWFHYLIVKTYGDEQKKRYMCEFRDCQEQISEWDDAYKKEHPEDKTFVRGMYFLKKKKKKNGYRRTFNVIDNKTNEVEFTGLSREIAEKFDCCIATVLAAAINDSVFQHRYRISVENTSLR